MCIQSGLHIQTWIRIASMRIQTGFSKNTLRGGFNPVRGCALECHAWAWRARSWKFADPVWALCVWTPACVQCALKKWAQSGLNPMWIQCAFSVDSARRTAFNGTETSTFLSPTVVRSNQVDKKWVKVNTKFLSYMHVKSNTSVHL